MSEIVALWQVVAPGELLYQVRVVPSTLLVFCLDDDALAARAHDYLVSGEIANVDAHLELVLVALHPTSGDHLLPLDPVTKNIHTCKVAEFVFSSNDTWWAKIGLDFFHLQIDLITRFFWNSFRLTCRDTISSMVSRTRASMGREDPNRWVAMSDPNRPTSRATTATKMQAPETLLLTIHFLCYTEYKVKLPELDPRDTFTAKIVCKLRPHE